MVSESDSHRRHSSPASVADEAEGCRPGFCSLDAVIASIRIHGSRCVDGFSCGQYRLSLLSGACLMLRSLSLALIVLSTTVSVGDDVTFESHVRPILKAHCFQCHGEAGEKQGGLDLRLRRLMAAGGESGPAFVENQPDESYLIERVVSGDMPPGDDKRLSQKDIQTLVTWIQSGAKTAREEPLEIGDGPLFTEEEKNYWAFQPVQKPAVPVVADAGRVRNPIDAFLLAAMPTGQHFARDAERFRLVRRAWFDLAGLPPSPDAALPVVTFAQGVTFHFNGDTIHVQEGGEVEYFHMLFDNHEIVTANGAASESFHPGEQGIGWLAEEVREEIFEIFPQLRVEVEGLPPGSHEVRVNTFLIDHINVGGDGEGHDGVGRGGGGERARAVLQSFCRTRMGCSSTQCRAVAGCMFRVPYGY